ncbi:MAG: cell shape-determining protein MreD [Verrucomicrobiales bacterium]|jgi:cell shape-determining protein MreD
MEGRLTSMYAILTFVMLPLALCVQEFIPRMGEAASFGIVLFFPVWFLCSAVTLPFPIMLGLAFFAGLLWDLRYVVDPGVFGMPPGIPGGIPGVTPFGISIVFFGILGSMMHGVQPLYHKCQMGFPILLTGAGIFAFRLFDYLFLNFKRGNFQFPAPVFREICATALVSMVLSPLIYFFLSWLSKSLPGSNRYAYGR